RKVTASVGILQSVERYFYLLHIICSSLMFRKSLFLASFLVFSIAPVVAQQIIEADVCIYGGTSSGVIAAYTAQKLGKKAILIEPGTHLGGMSSGGLGYTDIGNKAAITG